MIQTEQANGLNILEHGKQVWYYYQKLLKDDIEDMKIPKWYIQYKEEIHINLHTKEDIEIYTTYHDCGKARSLYFDELGRKHFHNHAYESSQIWLTLGGKQHIAQLMELDMIFHTETYEQIVNRNLDNKTICTLLLSALSELHANANMFGGIKSESFCIKYKKLESRAKKTLKHYFNESEGIHATK